MPSISEKYVYLVSPAKATWEASRRLVRIVETLSQAEISTVVVEKASTTVVAELEHVTVEKLITRRIRRKKIPLIDSLFYSLAAPAYLLKKALRRSPKAIIVFDTRDMVLFKAIGMLFGAPTILAAKPLSPELQTSVPDTLVRGNFFKAVNALGLALASRVLVTSKSAARDFGRKWFISKKKLRVAKLPLVVVDHEESKTVREQFLNEYELPDNLTLFAVSGPLHAKQNIQKCIRAMSAANTEKAVMFICQDGPDKKNLRSMAVGLGLSEQVFFVEDPRVYFDILRSVDVYLVADPVEDFSAWASDAIASGAALIAVDTAASNELTKNKKLLVDTSHVQRVAEKIDAIVNEKGLLDELKNLTGEIVKSIPSSNEEYLKSLL